MELSVRFMDKPEPMDKRKSAEEILIDAMLNIKAGFPGRVSHHKIMEVVSEGYGMNWLHFIGGTGGFRYRKQKRICMYLIHELSGFDYYYTSEIMGVDDHEIIIREIDKLIRTMRKNEKLRNEVLEIVKALKEE